MSDALPEIKTRGYWEVIIRPTTFKSDRIESRPKCKEIVRESVVELRGWDYPHYDRREEPSSGIDYVEQSVNWEHHLEFWRYYQSGQFVHFCALWEDWYERTTFRQTPPHEPGKWLSVFGAVYTLTEMYEFASRLAAKGHLEDSAWISVTLHGTEGRTLATFNERRLWGSYTCRGVKEIPRELTVATPNLMGRAAELALEHAAFVFQTFNWDVKPQAFKEDQRKLLERRL